MELSDGGLQVSDGGGLQVSDGGLQVSDGGHRSWRVNQIGTRVPVVPEP